MLHFLSMTISNFGPYKGEQVIDFTSKDGVTIFWGDNGRGKTTLLNAFRYALFGIIHRRNGILYSLKDMENTEGRDDGIFGFKIVLKMDNDGEIYELTRQYKPRKDVLIPKNDEDYEKLMFLKKNGTFLSPNDSEHELNTIMPEQVSRFFLFDGELLQEYEELLQNETTTGERIKEAIEKILGVPVLTNGLVDLQECLYSYDRQKAKAAQKDTKTQQYGLQLNAVNESITEHQYQIGTQKSNLSQLYKEKMALEGKMDETEQLRRWIADRDAKKSFFSQKQSELESVVSQLQSEMKNAWKGMLADSIASIMKALQDQITTLEQKKQNKIVADKFLNEIKKAYTDHKCPVCEQYISDTYLHVLGERIRKSESELSGLSEAESEQLLSLQGRMAIIGKLQAHSRQQAIKMLEDRKTNLIIDIGTLNHDIGELNSKITKYGDITEASGLAQKCAVVLAKIDITEKAIEEEKKLLEKAKDSKANIEGLINKQASGRDLLNATRQLALCQQICSIFEKGMSSYRDKLKENVEKDATEFFLHLSSDKDYTALQINENYGLSIVHRSGRLVPGRSSGFEHIVALSLIGALHKNAPLRGPIIMDSPFGRLDPTHKQNIVQLLPDIAEQSMLLVYTGEIDEQLAREALGGHLLREYHLLRVSSMHTKIE